MNTTTLTYNLQEAINAAKAVIPHASKNDVTPILMSAHLTPEAWYATDRYTIAKYTIEARDNTESIVLSYEALEWIAKINVRQLRRQFIGDAQLDYFLAVTQRTDSHGHNYEVNVKIMFGDAVERSQAFDGVDGNYPPVARLVDEWKPAHEAGIEAYPVKLNPVHIEKITNFVKRHEKEAPVTIELGKPYNHDETHKPSPVRFTYGNLTAIVQPNLMLG